ncbi:GNAT family N-acetyltransferase [Actinomadura sp. J1-007]|nr:GNAT family N-acetyltransferase [Actinomadura sp. J1-007]MWK34906.1 GNAT family N-acetyltransferase [Actinomadura sp. J1-007]
MTFRAATVDDLPEIVRLLADDPLGAARETPAAGASGPGASGAGADAVPAPYAAAFAAIEKDPNNLLVVAEADGRVAGTMQITYIPGLTYTGGERAQIEGVRIAAEQRGRGIGQAMIGWAIEQARLRGCRLVQLTTDRQRPDAVRFYQKMGFRPSHMGMKFHLVDG